MELPEAKNLLIPAYILVATIVREVPEYKIAHTEDRPRQIAMGTPMIRKTKNETKKNCAYHLFILLLDFVSTVVNAIFNKM